MLSEKTMFGLDVSNIIEEVIGGLIVAAIVAWLVSSKFRSILRTVHPSQLNETVSVRHQNGDKWATKRAISRAREESWSLIWAEIRIWLT
jgi:uncharacterized membrane protein YraQ (UPF0718 family)